MGFFALRFISPDIVQRLFGATNPLFNMMAAGIAVGVLVTPLVASVAEDAMHAVPNALREAAFGLGARRRTRALRIVFPAAVSGISGRLDPGHLPSDRRDDDRGDRRRWDRQARVTLNPCKAGRR